MHTSAKQRILLRVIDPFSFDCFRCRLVAPVALPVQPPGCARVGGKENQKKKQQWKVIELRAEVAPNGHTMPSFPPGARDHVQHEQNADHRRRAHFQPQQERDPDQAFDDADQITERRRVRLNQLQERNIAAQGTRLDVILQILREERVGEFAARQLVLAKKKKEDCRRDADESNCPSEILLPCGFGSGSQAVSSRIRFSALPNCRESSSILASSTLRIESMPRNLPPSPTTGRCR